MRSRPQLLLATALIGADVAVAERVSNGWLCGRTRLVHGRQLGSQWCTTATRQAPVLAHRIAGRAEPGCYLYSAIMAARRQVKREHILHAAIELFSAKRYDEVSIDDIAAAAGVAHGLLFHYFDNKRGLWLAVLRRFTDELIQIDAGLTLSTSLGERVRTFLDRHLIEMSNRPGLYRSIMRGAREVELDGVDFLEHELHPLALSRILALLEVESPTPALTFVSRCWAAVVEEATLDWLDNPDLVSRETLTEILVGYLAAGLSSADLIDPQSAGSAFAAALSVDQTS